MNKIGLHIGYWWGTGVEGDLFQMLELTHRAELDVIEINPMWLMQLDSAQEKEFSRCLTEYGMNATLNGGLDASNDIASDSPDIREIGVQYCKDVLKKMGSVGLNVWSGCNYSEWLRCPKAEDNAQKEKKRALNYCLESMQEIIKTAEEEGVDYCFEVLNRFEQFLFNTSKDAVTFAEQVGSDRAKVLLDSYHMNIEEDSFSSAIHYAGERNRLGHFHVGESNRRIPGVGESDMNWSCITNALKDVSYEGTLVMEPFILTSAHNAKRTRVWRDLSGGADIDKLVEDAKRGGEFLRNLLA